MRFKEEVEACTADEVALEIVFSGAIANAAQSAEMVSEGGIDITMTPAGAMFGVYPAARVLGAPFVFNNRRHWEKSMSGDVFELIQNEVEDKSGARVLGYIGGQRVGIISAIPIQSASDFKGLKIRAFDGSSVFSALGSSTVRLPSGEAASALASGAVDAFEASATLVRGIALYDVAQSFTAVNQRISTEFLMINRDTFDNLNDMERACVSESAAEASAFGRQAAKERDRLYRLNMTERGVSIYRLSDRGQLYGEARKGLEAFAAEIGGLELLARVAEEANCPNWCDENKCDDSQCALCSFCTDD